MKYKLFYFFFNNFVDIYDMKTELPIDHVYDDVDMSCSLGQFGECELDTETNIISFDYGEFADKEFNEDEIGANVIYYAICNPHNMYGCTFFFKPTLEELHNELENALKAREMKALKRYTDEKMLNYKYRKVFNVFSSKINRENSYLNKRGECL